MPLHECFHVPVTSCQRAEVKRVLHCDATTRADMDALLSETLPAVAIFSPQQIQIYLPYAISNSISFFRKNFFTISSQACSKDLSIVKSTERSSGNTGQMHTVEFQIQVKSLHIFRGHFRNSLLHKPDDIIR